MGNGYTLPILGGGLGATPRINSLLIKPASAVCNLDCAYCFYLDREADPYKALPARRMTLDTLERLVDTFLFYSYPNSVFAFQGGEPTLAGPAFFEKLVELQKHYGRDGQTVSNALQTNGILIDGPITIASSPISTWSPSSTVLPMTTPPSPNLTPRPMR